MEVVPPATANFSLRYVVPVIPMVCLAAALAFARSLAESVSEHAAAVAGCGEPAVVAVAPQGSGERTDQGGNGTT
jgi:hypothetical protein